MSNRFYVLEGLDGVGKSTVGSLLKDSGYTVTKTPQDSFPVPRRMYDHLPVKMRFLIYLASVIRAEDEIESADGIVFCDRYLLTTIAAAEAMGLDKSFISGLVGFLGEVLRPINTFLLTADKAEIARRMKGRGANRVDRENLKINDKILDGYRNWSKVLGHELTEIDTTIDHRQIVEYYSRR